MGFSNEEITGCVRMSRKFFWGDEKKKYFIMIADGDGMINADIRNGDKLFFEETEQADSGDIVVANLDGTYYCRRLIKKKGRTYLRRENGITPDLFVRDLEIRGKLISYLRSYKGA